MLKIGQQLRKLLSNINWLNFFGTQYAIREVVPCSFRPPIDAVSRNKVGERSMMVSVLNLYNYKQACQQSLFFNVQHSHAVYRPCLS